MLKDYCFRLIWMVVQFTVIRRQKSEKRKLVILNVLHHHKFIIFYTEIKKMQL